MFVHSKKNRIKVYKQRGGRGIQEREGTVTNRTSGVRGMTKAGDVLLR
jgi:hypothetical protein